MKTVIGTLVTAIVLFLFGYAYWQLNPLPLGSLGTATDPAAAESMLGEQFPASGAYAVPRPGMVQPTDSLSAMVIVRHELPESLPDPVGLLKGFAHYIAIALVLAFLLGHRAPLSRQLGRAALAGLAAVVVVEGTDLVWWSYPFGWKAWSVLYHELLFVIGALVLAPFLPRRADDLATFDLP